MYDSISKEELTDEKLETLWKEIAGVLPGQVSSYPTLPGQNLVGQFETEHSVYVVLKCSKSQVCGLTARQKEIAVQACSGLTSKEIAWNLKLSSSTVAKHLKRVYEKLEVQSRTELAQLAVLLRLS